MSTDNTRYSFWQFIEKYEIKIPLIQRDYVQGKEYEDKKKFEKRQDFISKLLTALTEGTGYHVDFVYGAPTPGNNDKVAFIPLDGQQRLTTLFLLHWLLICKSSVSNEEKSKLMKKLNCFSYETRNSSSIFCKKLAEFILHPEFGNKSITQVVKEQNWYSEDWNYDPTISNCLSMIDAMNKMLESKFKDRIDEAFENLFKPEKSITFDLLDMKEYKLTDGLYIKMNARGKDLTEFEHWKAHFIQLLEDKYKETSYKQEFTNKIEHEWADCFWGYVNKVDVEYPVIDNLFMRYFNYLTSLLYFRNIEADKEASYDETFEQIDKVYSSEENVLILFKSLDFITIHCKHDTKLFESLFHHNDSTLGSEGVRLFSKGNLNLLKRCIDPEDDDTFDLYEKILLFGILRYGSVYGRVDNEGFEYIRILRNFLLNTNQFNIKDLNVISNLRINRFSTYYQIINGLIGHDRLDYLKNIATSNGKGIAQQEIEYLDETKENKKALCRWLEDLSFTRGNIAAFKESLSTVPCAQVYSTIERFNKASHLQRVKILIAAGYKGKNIGYCKYGCRYFFGEKDRWDVIFSKDSDNVEVSVANYVQANQEIDEFIASNIPFERNFKYYALTYDEMLRSAGYWQKNDDEYSRYYFAIRGNYDDLDIISLKSFSSTPLRAYHTEPFASAVRLNIAREMPGVTNKLRNDSRFSDRATLHYIDERSEVFSMKCTKGGWILDKLYCKELRDKYQIGDTYLLRETEEKDLVMIGTDFVRDVLKAIKEKGVDKVLEMERY